MNANTFPVDLVQAVVEFNTIGGKRPPGGHFDVERVAFHLGMQLEELSEQLEAVAEATIDYTMRSLLTEFVASMNVWGERFKNGSLQGSVLRADREQLLDGGIDTAWVAIGAVIYQTPAVREAIAHIVMKNLGKFPNGQVLRDANDKIVKPAGWTPPDLSTFVDLHGQVD